jgi:hypothetical protein
MVEKRQKSILHDSSLYLKTDNSTLIYTMALVLVAIVPTAQFILRPTIRHGFRKTEPGGQKVFKDQWHGVKNWFNVGFKIN